MAYTNKARVQNYLLVTINDSFATQISEWISAVERFINNYCGREFVQEDDTEKLYDGDGSNTLIVDDLLTFTKIEILDEDGNVDYTIDSSDEYYLYPVNKTPKRKITLNSSNASVPRFLKGHQNVKVTGTFGYSVNVPEDVRLVATKLVAGIIEEKNIDIAGEIKSEKLGEYQVAVQDVSKMANHLDSFAVLDFYKKPGMEAV